MAMGLSKCKYKFFVDCTSQTECKHCGWNPEVDEQRKAKLRKKSTKSTKMIVGAKK